MPVDINIIVESLPALWNGLKLTALISVLGIPLGLAIGTMMAYMVGSKALPLRMIGKAYVEMVRNVPFLILVYLTYFGFPKLGINISAEAVAIGTICFYTGGYFCEILRASLASVSSGQVAAASSLGLSPVQVQRYIVLPQLLGFLIPPLTSLTIMMFKDSAIFSVIGLSELTYQSNLVIANTFAYAEILCTTAAIYWICSILMDAIGQYAEKKTTY